MILRFFKKKPPFRIPADGDMVRYSEKAIAEKHISAEIANGIFEVEHAFGDRHANVVELTNGEDLYTDEWIPVED